MALVLPVLVFLLLGTADLGRAFYFNIELTGASRAGMRTGVIGSATDIGQAVRSEPNSSIPNDVPRWGATGTAQSNANCTGAAQSCGDPQGCAPAAFVGSQVACFAVRTCNFSAGACTSYGAWGTRPTAVQGSLALDVRVVYKFTPMTPLVSGLSGGAIYLTSDSIGTQLF